MIISKTASRWRSVSMPDFCFRFTWLCGTILCIYIFILIFKLVNLAVGQTWLTECTMHNANANANTLKSKPESVKFYLNYTYHTHLDIQHLILFKTERCQIETKQQKLIEYTMISIAFCIFKPYKRMNGVRWLHGEIKKKLVVTKTFYRCMTFVHL